MVLQNDVVIVSELFSIATVCNSEHGHIFMLSHNGEKSKINNFQNAEVVPGETARNKLIVTKLH